MKKMARSNLTEEEMDNRFIQQMVVETEQVKRIYGMRQRSPMGDAPKYEKTGRKWYEYRSTRPDPNGSKYLGVPFLSPPSLSIQQIYDMLRSIYRSEVDIELLEDINDPAIPGQQIIFDGYQFLTPRDISMINRGLFTTLSFHNKLIELFREPVSGVMSDKRI